MVRLWVWGYQDLDAFIAMADGVHLDGVVPFLVTHGENDRQIPVEYARRSYDQATASPKRDLRIFDADEGATEHVGLGPDFIDDYYKQIFGGWNVSSGFTREFEHAEVSRPSDLPKITDAMLRRGFSEPDIRKVLGENVLRVFRDILVEPAGAEDERHRDVSA